ncbi:MAG: aminotransferase class V-fold PLP-dependent enzyme [Candidatus Nomurabacteria bacterium]|jgi:cysteine desulfurase/selenocysteine lyase|nr:aminotransferase class V-fold PLP-dependent enzyme [Candidatus Nomurabacteria bacterium]
MESDFKYLDKTAVYFDSACQSLRPQPVIDALNEYYTQFNSCGERVKYAWGVKTDQKVEETRALVLDYLKLKPKDYFVSFTLNTTYGINLILSQLSADGIKKVVTSDIEHNSPFLATMTFSKTHNLPREVITRRDDGTIDVDKYDFSGAVVVVNSASNIDGRRLENLDELIKKIHKQGGLIIIDAAQGMATSSDLLEKTSADAICFSAHKMYAPSLGVMVVRRDLAPKIKTTFIGGGMVDDVEADSYQLSAESDNHIYTKFESGLQAWGEIVALGAAIKWLKNAKKSSQIADFSDQIFNFLDRHPKVHLTGQKAAPTMSFYVDDLDSHLLAEALSDQGIMARSGYFCCHYYLDHLKHYPPLLRISLGLHNSQADVDKFISVMEKI